MTGRHAKPLPPSSPLVIAFHARRRWVIDGLLFAALALPVAAVCMAGVNVAPDARNAASAMPTVEQREPTGHGGPIGPLATPSIGADGAWQPEDGPVVVDGTPLETPQPTAEAVEAAPEPVTETEALPEPLAAAEPAPEPQPTGLLALVNANRAEAGCGPVTIADDLTQQAQAHAETQAAGELMFHSTGVRNYDTWGENVAYGYETEAEAHAGWMGSPPHRETILNCAYTVMGYGSAVSASGARYWTQDFAA